MYGSGIRIGQGYDVHRLVEGRLLILGGVEIPFHMGLDGHSDADVLTQIIDALLGTIGGDIGQLFPIVICSIKTYSVQPCWGACARNSAISASPL